MGDETKKVNNVFRKGMKAAFPRVHWQRVENGEIGPGTPDINFCLDSIEYWFESKWVPSKTGARFSHPLNASQCAWLLSRTRAGGSAWVIARRVDTFRIWHGSWAKEIVDGGWDAVAMHFEFDKPWDWAKVIECTHHHSSIRIIR